MAQFKLLFTVAARANLTALTKDHSAAKRLKAVRKTVGLLERNPRHPGLNTHEYETLAGPNGEKLFEAYAENRTPAAFRVFLVTAPAARRLPLLP